MKQFATTLDDYVWNADDKVVEGEIEEGKRYREPQFNRSHRDRRARTLSRQAVHGTDRPAREDAGVLRNAESHAALVRDLYQSGQNQQRSELLRAGDGRGCGALGERWLRTFQDNEKTIPTILTTSQKLSTGVNARNVRNIVLMRPINSMIEFKQIIGRGTRLFDGKDYFTIYDFVKAYEHFNDPEWDGEPMEPVIAQAETVPPKQPGCEEEGVPSMSRRPSGRGKIVIKLADGKERSHPAHDGDEVIAVWTASRSRPTQMVEQLFGELPRFFKDEDELPAAVEQARYPQGAAAGARRKGIWRRAAQRNQPA